EPDIVNDETVSLLQVVDRRLPVVGFRHSYPLRIKNRPGKFFLHICKILCINFVWRNDKLYFRMLFYKMSPLGFIILPRASHYDYDFIVAKCSYTRNLRKTFGNINYPVTTRIS